MQFLIAVRPGTAPPSPDRPTVEHEVAKVTRRFTDDLSDLLALAMGEDRGRRLARRYAPALPEAYKEDFAPAIAARDIARLEELAPDDGLAFELYVPEDRRRRRPPAQGLPHRAVGVAGPGPAHLHADGHRGPRRAAVPDRAARRVRRVDLRLRAAAARRRGASTTSAPSTSSTHCGCCGASASSRTGFNALVVRTRLTWWQANVLRAYAKYLRQAGTTFSSGLHRAGAGRERRHRGGPRRPVRVALRPRPGRRAPARRRRDQPGREDRGPAGGRGQPRPGPHPAGAARAHRRHPAHQRLPHRCARATGAARSR